MRAEGILDGADQGTDASSLEADGGRVLKGRLGVVRWLLQRRTSRRGVEGVRHGRAASCIGESWVRFGAGVTGGGGCRPEPPPNRPRAFPHRPLRRPPRLSRRRRVFCVSTHKSDCAPDPASHGRWRSARTLVPQPDRERAPIQVVEDGSCCQSHTPPKSYAELLSKTL